MAGMKRNQTAVAIWMLWIGVSAVAVFEAAQHVGPRFDASIGTLAMSPRRRKLVRITTERPGQLGSNFHPAR